MTSLASRPGAPGAYAVRRQLVATGRAASASMSASSDGSLSASSRNARPDGLARVLVAVFPLRAGGVACLQLQDEGRLRRGGVYLGPKDDAERPAVAPRFDELFAELARRSTSQRVDLERLLREGELAARATRPRLDPAALVGIAAVLSGAADLDRAPRPDGSEFSAEELLAACMLIFVSEEERYPRPRFRGAAATLDTLLEVLAHGKPPAAMPPAPPVG